MNRYAVLLEILVICFVTGCSVNQPVDPMPVVTMAIVKDGGLDKWVSADLIPYLQDQVKNHPLLRGKSFLVVATDGDTIKPRIDELSVQLREQIIDVLVAQPGVRLARRGTTKPLLHHRSLDDVLCSEDGSLDYYLGIDVGLTPGTNRLHVSIRALEANYRGNGGWISGFGQAWSGTISSSQKQALQNHSSDEYLRGLRTLPFEDNQPDLLAAYLAQNLSCLLRHRQEDEVLLSTRFDTVVPATSIKTTLRLVDNYMMRYREVQMTDDIEKANVILRSETHLIDPANGLYLISMAAKFKGNHQYLTGLATQSYVRIGREKTVTLATRTKDKKVLQLSSTRKPEKIPVKLQLVSRPQMPIKSQVKLQVKPQATSPTMQQAKVRAIPALITKFQLITTSNQSDCATSNPWQKHYRAMTKAGTLRSGDCIAIEAKVSRRARIFLAMQNENGDVTRLLPPSCLAPSAKTMHWFHPSQLLRYPSFFGKVNKLMVNASRTKDSLYMIATTDVQQAKRLTQELQRFPDMCSRSSEMRSDNQFNWEKNLQQWAEQSKGQMEWQQIALTYY